MSMMGSPIDLTPEDIEIMSNLLCVLPHDEERQSRVRSDVRTRLTRGLEGTKNNNGLIWCKVTC